MPPPPPIFAPVCELRYIGLKCGLGSPNLVPYTGLFVITGFVISRFLSIQIPVILPGPKKYLVITGTSLIGVRFIGVPLYVPVTTNALIYFQTVTNFTWSVYKCHMQDPSVR